LADSVEKEVELPYSDIPGFVRTGIPGHAGRCIYGRLGGKKVLLFSGRVHYYEGFSFSEVTLQVQTAKGLGAGAVALSCSVGGLNPSFKPGDFLFVRDHINFQGANPLYEMAGACGDSPFGSEPSPFVNLYGAYRGDFFDELAVEADKQKVNLHQGVLCAVLGPVYETPAEAKMLRLLGADAVCMSTIPEAIMARYLGLEVAALSLITNVHSDRMEDGPKHDEVIDVSSAGKKPFIALMKKLVSLF
jgi:purine-nucleoside phosphorylase